MKMTFFQHKSVAVCLIPALASVLVWLADTAGLLDFLSSRSYDALFCIRAEIETARPEAPVVMIDVDDTTLAEPDFQIPVALWHEYFAQVIEAVAESRVKVIGLDYLLPPVLFDDKIADYSQVWRKAVILAQNKGVPVVTGYIQKESQRIAPHKKYVFAVGAQNLGFFNLTPDKDDVVRRHRLFAPAENGERLNSFGYLLFKALKPEYQPASEEMYIDFIPQRLFFPRYSFLDVYRKVKERDIFFLNQHFKDKIVIIGAVDSLSQDRCLTPLRYFNGQNSKRTPGPDIQAGIVHTLYGGRFFRETSATARLGIYFVLALITGLFTNFLRFRRILYSLLFLNLSVFSISLWGFLNLLILPLAQGIVAIWAALIFFSCFRYAVLDREKRRMHRLFNAFLTPQVAGGVLKLKNSELLEGKKMRLCILFSDIRGFTTFSKQNGDLEVVRRLNEYYAPMSEAVSEGGGVVSRFFGDGLLAFFGAFEETDNPSAAGVNAALKMVRELKILNHDWKRDGKESFSIGIGLHTGDVALGGIGSEKRMEFTLTGDTANLASRVEGKTKDLKETILISKNVYEDVHDQFPDTIQFEDKGVQDIKGRSAERLYAVKIKE